MFLKITLFYKIKLIKENKINLKVLKILLKINKFKNKVILNKKFKKKNN